MDNDNEFLQELQNDKYVNQIELDKQQDKEDKKQCITRTYVCKTIIQYV